MPKIILNKIDVARKGAKAYQEYRLSAQGNTPRCSYRDSSGCPCVVGASLDDETAMRWDTTEEGTTVSQLHHYRYFKTDDLEYLSILQDAHDRWASRVGGTIEGLEEEFVEVLNRALPESEQIKVNDPRTKAQNP